MTFAMRRGWRPSARGVVAAGLVGLIVLGMVAAWISPERVIGAAEQLMGVVRALGVRGAVVFAVVQVLVAVSGILPASLLGVAAGAIYGLVPGFLLAAVSTLAGALLSFFLSRSLFRSTVERLAAHRSRLRDLDARIARDGWKLVCLLRVSPVMPFSADESRARSVRGRPARLLHRHACVVAGAVRLCLHRHAHGRGPCHVGKSYRRILVTACRIRRRLGLEARQNCR